LSQGFTIYYFVSVNDNLERSIAVMNNSVNSLNSRLDSLEVDSQAKFSELSDSILNAQSSVSTLSTQFNVLKASTSADFSGVIDDSVSGVVSIRTNNAQGTGFFITDDGFVVTNAHVLANAKYAEVIDSSKVSRYATLIGINNNLDLALLKVDSKNNNYLEFTNDVVIGQKVIAIGNPLGLSFSVSEGIISAVDRSVQGYSSDYIQTDVALNPGNSGGPLINKDGLVVGINNFKLSDAENIGFALPSRFIVPEINLLVNDTIVFMN